MSPRVSVVMPVWNVEPYLRECMDSILNQTMGDFEFICIDDASDDGSPAILAEYAARDKRVKLLRTEHEGAYVARAAGIKVASGEFLYFMDSDDVLDTRAFEELFEVIDRDKLDQIIFSAEVFSDEEDEQVFAARRKRFERYYEIPEKLCGQIMSGPDLMFALEAAGRFFVSPPFRLTKLAPYKAADFPFPHGAPFHADEFFTPFGLYASERAEIVNRRYYRRRVRPGSISTITSHEEVHFSSLLNIIAALCRFEPFIRDLPIRRAEIASHMLKLVKALMRRGEPLDAETQTALLREIRLDLPPELRFFLATCFLPMTWELAARIADAEKRKRQLQEALAKEIKSSLEVQTRLEAELKRRLDEAVLENQDLKKKATAFSAEAAELKRSASYRVGMILTWPVRKLYRLFVREGV